MTHDQTTPAPVEVTLKPCPFCGHQRRYVHADAPCGDRRYWTVICEACEAHGPPFSVCSGGEKEAIAAWNTRHSAPAGEVAMQHVAYFDEGQFHWTSGIAPRDCELYAKWSGHTAPVTHPAPPADLITLLHQYRSDLLRPPAPDSRERRIVAIDAALAKHGGA